MDFSARILPFKHTHDHLVYRGQRSIFYQLIRINKLQPISAMVASSLRTAYVILSYLHARASTKSVAGGRSGFWLSLAAVRFRVSVSWEMAITKVTFSVAVVLAAVAGLVIGLLARRCSYNSCYGLTSLITDEDDTISDKLLAEIQPQEIRKHLKWVCKGRGGPI